MVSPMCAEKIYPDEEGHIAQAEVTSCGLNGGPLLGTGRYPAYIACHLTRGGKAVFSHPGVMREEYPYLTQDCKDTEPCRGLREPVQYIHNIKDGSCIGYKYFLFQGMGHITLSLRGKAKGKFQVMEEEGGEVLGEIPVEIDSGEWRCVGGDISIHDGVHPLFFFFQGEGMLDMIDFELE